MLSFNPIIPNAPSVSTLYHIMQGSYLDYVTYVRDYVWTNRNDVFDYVEHVGFRIQPTAMSTAEMTGSPTLTSATHNPSIESTNPSAAPLGLPPSSSSLSLIGSQTPTGLPPLRGTNGTDWTGRTEMPTTGPSEDYLNASYSSNSTGPNTLDQDIVDYPLAETSNRTQNDNSSNLTDLESDEDIAASTASSVALAPAVVLVVIRLWWLLV